MKNKAKIYIVFWTILVINISCKTLNVSKISPKSTTTTSGIIKNRLVDISYPEEMLLRNASLKIKDESQTTIKLTVYIKKDELIFVNGRYMGFEVFRMRVDDDSIKFINRLQRTYYFKDSNSFLNKLGISSDLSELQNFIYSGFLFPQGLNTSYIKNNFVRGEENIHMDYPIDNGRRINLNYDLSGFLKNVIFSDHPNEIYVNMEMIRDETELERISGEYIKTGNIIDWSLDINQIDFTNYNNTDFRIGKNYYEIQNLF